MSTTTPSDIEAAWKRIEPYVRTTPVIRLNRGLLHPDAEVFLKLELMQVTGSFKPRGAFNRILSNNVPPAGIIAASGGNHGLATAYAARALGYHAEIFVPTISSPVKQQRLRDYGATLHVTGANYKEALQASTTRARETGALVVHAYNQMETIAGQGTCGREFETRLEFEHLVRILRSRGFAESPGVTLFAAPETRSFMARRSRSLWALSRGISGQDERVRNRECH